MPKTLRNQFNKYLTYEKIMEAHNKAKKGKGFRKELILFNLKQEDQYIKHNLHIKYYCRYLDDSIVIVKTKNEAKQALENIKIYLKENLGLELNQKTQIFKNKQGVNFCGYKINEYRLKIRDKGKRKLIRLIVEAITTIPVQIIQPTIATTMALPTPTATSVFAPL